MSKYAALRLRKLPVIYWVEAPEAPLEAGQAYIVETKHGKEVSKVLRVVEQLPKGVVPDKDFFIQFIGAVGDAERQKLLEIAEKEKKVFISAREKVEQHKLNMKLLKAEYLFDYSRLIFYFKAENKVDFRELLKTLAAAFKTRIELRQIGVRDETKLLGGLGCCGKIVCCSHFMTSFYPVSTKMAKEQNLTLNPAKLSGICGRLLCCLNHEQAYYASFHGIFPKLTSDIVVENAVAKVIDINYITQKMTVSFADRRKLVIELKHVKGRKDPTTGRNLWWAAKEGEDEPDLSLLLQNLNPPGTGKRKRKADENAEAEAEAEATDKNDALDDNNEADAEAEPDADAEADAANKSDALDDNNDAKADNNAKAANKTGAFR